MRKSLLSAQKIINTEDVNCGIRQTAVKLSGQRTASGQNSGKLDKSTEGAISGNTD
jgi:hypothetical protein